MTTTADLLDEYARALSLHGGEIDGRAEQTPLNILAAAIRGLGNAELPQEEVENLRECLNLCPHGNGCWTEFCSDYCTEEDA